MPSDKSGKDIRKKQIASSTSPNECMKQMRMLFDAVRNDPYLTDQLIRGVEDALNNIHRKHKQELYRASYGGVQKRNDWICYTVVDMNGAMGLAIYPNGHIQNEADKWMSKRGIKLQQAYLHVNSGMMQILQATKMVKQFKMPHKLAFN